MGAFIDKQSSSEPEDSVASPTSSSKGKYSFRETERRLKRQKDPAAGVSVLCVCVRVCLDEKVIFVYDAA